MKLLGGNLRLSATDVSNHLACRHLTQLDLQTARGERSAPDWAAPDLKVIQELGKRHEAAYLKYLEEEKKLRVARLAEHGADVGKRRNGIWRTPTDSPCDAADAYGGLIRRAP